MNIIIFISLLFFLQFFYWFIARRASKNAAEKSDYFLADKSVKLLPLTMTFLATQVGGGVVLGAADEAYLYGWQALFYPLGASLGLIFLGSGIGRKLANFKVSTVAQIFEVVYSSSILKKIASLLSILSLFMILIAQIIASNKFLTSLGLTYTPLFILFWAIVIIYTAQGGLKAVISTDLVQASFFSIVFLFCFGFVFYNNSSTSLTISSQTEIFSFLSPKLCGWLFMPLLFMIIEQDMGQRCFAGASPRIVSLAATLAGIGTIIVCMIPVFFGVLASGSAIEIPKGASVLMTTIEQTTTPLITALVGCAIVAAIISTATSLINAISSNISNDFNLPFKAWLDPMRTIRWMTCLISIAAIFLSFYFTNIVDLLIQSYELSVCCLFIPLMFGLFKKQGNFCSALFSILMGAAGFILFRIFPIQFPKEIASVLLSLVGFCFGEIYVLTIRLLCNLQISQEILMPFLKNKLAPNESEK